MIWKKLNRRWLLAIVWQSESKIKKKFFFNKSLPFNISIKTKKIHGETIWFDLKIFDFQKLKIIKKKFEKSHTQTHASKQNVVQNVSVYQRKI